MTGNLEKSSPNPWRNASGYTIEAVLLLFTYKDLSLAYSYKVS